MTAHEVIIRFGRPFDIRIRGEFRDTAEVTIPFADQQSAEAALREVTLSVRAVHDTGGEDYRPVVAGEVVETEAEAKFAADLAAAVSAERERARAALPATEPGRDMNDLSDWGAGGQRETLPNCSLVVYSRTFESGMCRSGFPLCIRCVTCSTPSRALALFPSIVSCVPSIQVTVTVTSPITRGRRCRRWTTSRRRGRA